MNTILKSRVGSVLLTALTAAIIAFLSNLVAGLQGLATPIADPGVAAGTAAAIQSLGSFNLIR